MSYFVSHDGGVGAAIDEEPTLEDAHAHASRLLSEGKLDVAIPEGSGSDIRGDDLIACCWGEKKLTAKVRAI